MNIPERLEIITTQNEIINNKLDLLLDLMCQLDSDSHNTLQVAKKEVANKLQIIRNAEKLLNSEIHGYKRQHYAGPR